MNSDTFAAFSTAFPSTHPFALPAAGFTIATTTRTAATLVNGQVATLPLPLQTDIRGSSAPLDPNTSNTLSINQMGRAGTYRGQNAPYFTSASFDAGRPFRVRTVGTINVGATQTAKNVIITLFQGVSATLASDNILYTPAAQGTTGIGASATGVVAGHYNFVVEVCLIWDAVSQNLVTTECWSSVCGQYTARIAGTTINPVTAPSALSFLPAFEFGLANAANNVIFTELALEQV